jgi:hypothetical protein
MTATVGTNSYVTEAEATAYFADKYGYDSWVAETNKEGALVSACQHLDNMCQWFGNKVLSTQVLEFPRYPDAEPVPQDVKDAQCEIAYNIVATGSTTTEADDPLTELKAGSVLLKFDVKSPNNPLINDLTTQLLAPYGLCPGNSGTKIIPMMRQ